MDQAFRERARDLAARDPIDRAWRTLKNILWAPVLQMTWASTRILMWINWPLLLFGLWGSGVAVWKDPQLRREAWPIWVLMSYVWVAHAVVWPQARYVLPGLVPFLALSAFGLQDLFSAGLGWVQSRWAHHPSSN